MINKKNKTKNKKKNKINNKKKRKNKKKLIIYRNQVMKKIDILKKKKI